MTTSEKYGFVYIWRDRKRNKFYLGCHWGTETDGYVCSSKHMRAAYSRRPHDFKRRVIQRVYTTRSDLLEAEYKWLQLISDAELGGKYYNHCNHHFGHWSATDRAADITSEIKSKYTPEVRAKIAAANKGKIRSAAARAKISASQKGRRHTAETKTKMSGRTPTKEQRARMSAAGKGRTHTAEHRSKIHAAIKGRVWITDGSSNRRVYPSEVPEGWRLGQTKTPTAKV